MRTAKFQVQAVASHGDFRPFNRYPPSVSFVSCIRYAHNTHQRLSPSLSVNPDAEWERFLIFFPMACHTSFSRQEPPSLTIAPKKDRTVYDPNHHFLNSPSWVRYLLAAMILLAMLTIRLALLPAEAGFPYLMFYPGIAITIFLCGIGPGLLFIALAAFAAAYFFFPAHWDLSILGGTTVFVASALAILGIIYAFQRRTEQQQLLLRKEIAERKRIETVSAESALRLSGIIDSAMDAIISLDEQQQILLFNPAAEQMFDYPASEMLGASIERLIPVRFRQAHAEHMQYFGKTGISSRKMSALGDVNGVRRDGSEFPIEATISRIVIAGKTIFTVILRDISERRRTEEVLLNSRRQLSTLIEQAPISMAMLDQDLNYITTSRRWLAEYGRGFTDLSGHNHYEVNPDLSEKWKRVHRKALAGVVTRKEQDLWVKADGSRQWLRWAVYPWTDEAGGVGGIIISAEDITRQTLIEMALRASEDDLIRAQAVGNIGSWRLNVRCNELTWSAENHRIFGIPEGIPLSYETFLAQVHPDDRDAVNGKWQAALHGAPYAIEHRLLVDGTVKWVIEKAELEFDALGNLLGGFGITQDITERRLMEDQLKEANDQLAAIATERAAHLRELAGELTQAEQRERDRLYELLHDHVQPLLIAARLGLSGLSKRTAQEETLRIVGEVREHISSVIQTARTLSVELNPPLVRDRGLIPGLESLCCRVRSNYELEITMSCAPHTEPASMTIRLICFKVVRELLMNVVKYADTRQASLDLDLAPDHMLRITVRDNGAGFDPAEKHNGSGLANIERRLGMVGGSLSIASTPGAGTSAILLAPLGLAVDQAIPEEP